MKKQFLTFILILFYIAVSAQNFEWAKNMGGNSLANGQAVAVDDSGYVYTTGYFTGTVDFDPGIGTYSLSSSSTSNTDIFILKSNALGNFVWARRLGNANGNWSYSITVDSLGSVYIVGYFSGTMDFNPNPGITNNKTSIGTEDLFILKLNRLGNYIWARNVGGANTYSTGRCMVQDKSGNLYITGGFSGTVDFNPGIGIDTLSSNISYSNSFILKLDASGNYKWVKGFLGPDHAYGMCLAIDSIGNICSTGNFMGTIDFDPGPVTYTLSAIGLNTYISKLDSSGNFVWTKYIEPGDVKSIYTDNSGNVSIAGSFDNGTVEVDPGTSNYTLTSLSGNTNLFIVKLDIVGNFMWGKNIENTYSGENTSIASDKAGNIYTTGYFYGAPVDFDPDLSTTHLLVPYNIDLFILKLNASGNFVWVKNAGGANSNIGAQAICFDTSENIYTSGWFSGGTATFDIGSGNIYLTAVASDLFISKLNPSIITTSKKISTTNNFDIIIFPNPTNGNVNIVSSEKMKLNLVDNLGSIIQPIELNEGNNFQQTIHIPISGIYFLSGQSAKEAVQQKIIVTN